MASINPAGTSYVVANDNVPEVYRDFFDNGDWTMHKFTVAGSWAFFVIAVIAHVFVWNWKAW